MIRCTFRTINKNLSINTKNQVHGFDYDYDYDYEHEHEHENSSWLRNGFSLLLGLIFLLVLGTASRAEDWPMWGYDGSRNMVSSERGLPDAFDPGKSEAGSMTVDLSTAKNIKWAVKLGSQAYGNPVVAGGKVLVGTNNENPRDPKYTGDRSVVMCFDEATGKYLWQLAIPKLGAGKVSDWEYIGICSSPAIEGDRAYFLSNRCEVVCISMKGMAGGNQGPFKDEAQYTAGPGKPPIPQGPTDGDIIWRYDMREELGVFPHNITSCSPLILDNKIFTATSNGVDWSHTNVPSPKAPSLIAVDKATGAEADEEGSGISSRLMHANWSSPAHGKIGDREMVIFGAGDGFCYGFSPEAKKDEEGILILQEIRRFDCNPPHYRTRDGKPIRYSEADGPSEVIGTPVFYKGRVYVTIGQDPEHGEGVGNLSCIDASKTGDITQSGKVWTSEKISRSMSTPSIADDLVYISDYAGDVHCFDANTGQLYWTHKTRGHIWGSTLVADGKVYVGNESGELTILATGKQEKVLNKVRFSAPIYNTPIVANGVLFIATHTHLYAIAAGAQKSQVAGKSNP